MAASAAPASACRCRSCRRSLPTSRRPRRRSPPMAHDILIVDDEADIRMLIAGTLKDEGYETRAAADGEGALAQVRQRPPSLVILDIWLQGSSIDGLEVLDTVLS